MKSPRETKAEKISKFKETVSDSKAVVLAVYKGLTVFDMEDLRTKVREAGGQVAIIKNTLAKVALNELGISDLDDDLTGQVAFVFSVKDAVLGTKIAHTFSRDNENLRLVAGYFDGRRISTDEVKALAMMPSRENLQARFVGILLAPMAEFVGTMQAPLQEFIGTLDAKVAKMEESGDPVAA